MTGDLTIKTFSTLDSARHALFKKLDQKIYTPEAWAFKKEESSSMQNFWHGAVVFKNNEPAARACFYHNPQLYYNNGECLLIGNFESVQDNAVVQCLFEHAADIARRHNLSFIMGPMNGSTWDDYRLPLDNKAPLFFTEHPTPHYYNDLFTENGFSAIGQYVSCLSTDFVFDTVALQQIGQQIQEAGMQMRTLRLNDFETELKRIYALCSVGFQNSFLYTAIPEQEFIKRYERLKSFIDPTFALLAEDAEGALQGLYLCLPDLYSSGQKRLIIKTIVKHPECSHKGLMAWMGAEIYRRAQAQNYQAIIHAFMHDAARSNRLSQYFGGSVYRRYALYGKAVP